MIRQLQCRSKPNNYCARKYVNNEDQTESVKEKHVAGHCLNRKLQENKGKANLSSIVEMYVKTSLIHPVVN